QQPIVVCYGHKPYAGALPMRTTALAFNTEDVMARKFARAAVITMFAATVFCSHFGLAQGIAGFDTAALEEATGLKGQVIAEEKVFKIGKPRADVKVQVDQWAMAPFMGLGSWAAFTPGHGGAIMMGDTVLFEDEVNPVMSAAFDAGLEVTALHNHFFFHDPKDYFMHIRRSGDAEALPAGGQKGYDKIPPP